MPTRAVIADADTWTPSRWHGRRDDSMAAGSSSWLQWKVTQEGILVRGEPSVRRTKGQPITVRRIADIFFDSLELWADVFALSESLLSAVVATESGGRAEAERAELHLKDVSIGLGQTLTATASGVYKGLKAERRAFFPTTLDTLVPIPRGGSLDAWRAVLRDAHTSIGLSAAVLHHLNETLELQRDPVLLYAAYNAGGVYEQQDDPWGLRNYDPDGRGPKPGALDHFTRWYGDACAVYGTQ